VCKKYTKYPPEFRGTADNRRKGYLKRYKWFHDNFINPKIKILTAKREK
jgi:hypothetical protein